MSDPLAGMQETEIERLKALSEKQEAEIGELDLSLVQSHLRVHQQEQVIEHLRELNNTLIDLVTCEDDEGEEWKG